MLAEGHDQVMNSMIEELRDIVSSGCVREDVEPHYQEQNDHPLTYLAYTLELSLSATTALACIDKDILEVLAIKVARQQTRMKEAEASAQGNRQRDDCPRARKPKGNRSSIVPDNVADTLGSGDSSGSVFTCDPYRAGKPDGQWKVAGGEHTWRSLMARKISPRLMAPSGILSAENGSQIQSLTYQLYPSGSHASLAASSSRMWRVRALEGNQSSLSPSR